MKDKYVRQMVNKNTRFSDLVELYQSETFKLRTILLILNVICEICTKCDIFSLVKYLQLEKARELFISHLSSEFSLLC